MLDLCSVKALFPISTERFDLQLFSRCDLTPDYVGWLNDEEVVKYSNQRFLQHTLLTCEEYFNQMERNDALFLAIYPRDEAMIIGTMTVYFNRRHGVADIGILLGNRAHWGVGVGRECWARVLRFLLSDVNVRKVTGGALESNKAMINIMRSTGMVCDGVRTSHEVIASSPVNVRYFSKFSND